MARTPARLALVTGTQGKSSTCQFLATLCSGTGSSVHLGGNIGTPLIEQLSSMRPDDIVVLELSSYQLEALPPVPRASAQVVVAQRRNLLLEQIDVRHDRLITLQLAGVGVTQQELEHGNRQIDCAIPY